MKCPLLFQLPLFIVVFIFSSLVSDIHAGESSKYDLTLTIHCPESNLKQGDEIPVVFTITNEGKTSYIHDDRNYDRSGRMEEYKLIAKREDGTIAPDPRANREPGISGGLSAGQKTIKFSESFSKTIALNRWALINKPGRYSITGIYNTDIWGDPKAKQAVISEPMQITVKPRTDEEMVSYIGKLKIRLQTIEDRYEKDQVVKKLMYTCDHRIVPTLLDSMYEKGGGFWEAEAFLYYLPHDLEIKDTVLEAAKKHGLANGMLGVLEELGCSEEQFKEIILISLTSGNIDILSAGTSAAQEYPDDKYMSYLIDIATGPKKPCRHQKTYEIARWRAIPAVAYNRTDEGVKTLKILLNDTDKNIRETVADAIRQAYRRHPVYPKYSDDEYTTELIAIMTDFKNPMWTRVILEIARTRTEDGVKAIKALLDNPDKYIPIAETDDGVKAIRDLFKNPDKDIRELTAGIIRAVYRTYPGRPLRNDDFGEEFRESPEERKEKILEVLRNRDRRLKTKNSSVPSMVFWLAS